MNVGLLGLGNAGATLAARFLVATNVILTNSIVEDNPDLARVFQLPDTENDVYLGGAVNIHGRGNFPYGYSVQADVDV